MKTTKTINLQLFADDSEVDLSSLKDHFTDEELQSVVPKEEPAPEPQSEPEPKEEPVPDIEPEPNPEPTPEQTAPDSDKVSKHVPYDRFKEVNERNKVLAAELAALKARQSEPAPQVQTPVQTQPAPQPPQQADIRSQINRYAEEEAKRRLKIEGDPREFMFTEPEKYEDYVAEKTSIRIEETNKYNSYQTTRKQNADFVNELKTIPDFPTVYQFALAELDELPGKQARAIGSAFDRVDKGIGTKEDQETIRKFATECQNKMKGITTQPPQDQAAISMPVTQPVTNPLDKTAGLPRATNLSGARTAAMSWAQVEALIREGKTDQIPEDMIKQIDPRLLD